MSIRMLALDIDGTILTSQRVMSFSTHQALLRCHHLGILSCIFTARSGRIVFKPGEIPWDHAFLQQRGSYYNGATIFDISHRFYQHTPIPGDLVCDLCDFISNDKNDLQIALQHDDIYHSFKHEMSPLELTPWGFAPSELLPFSLAKLKPTTKIMVYAGTDFLHIREDISDLHLHLVDQFRDSANFILADSCKAIYILSKYASKGNAVRTIAQLHGIDDGSVAVFGDDTTDLSMFGLFGHSIAMGNAIDPVKAKATFITRTNDEDGVPYAIKHYLGL
jgi:Cof subfamily protein (haloacid dehalogenase superfamily)